MLSFKLFAEGALPWKEVPEEEKEEAWKLIEAHNNSPEIDKERANKAWYFIDVTGRHQVYYTFWRWRNDMDPRVAAFIKNPIYFGNLSTDLLSSVKKALSKVPKSTRIELEQDETRTHLIGKPQHFTFGKYRGELMADVYLKDPKYFATLDQHMDPRYQFTNSNQAIMLFARLYYEEKTKENRATSKSQYVQQTGEWYIGPLTIYNIKEGMGTDFNTGKPQPYKKYSMVDPNENKFQAYNIEKYFPNVQKGDTIDVRAKLKGQKEVLGIKFNVLNYVRPPKPGWKPPKAKTPKANDPTLVGRHVRPWDVNAIYSKPDLE